ADTVDVQPFGRNVDEPFNREGDLWTAGAAVSLGRNGVGENRNRAQRCDRNIITASDQPGPFAQRRERNTARARVADIGCAQGEKPSALIERQLEFGYQIAALIVADEAFRARRSVLDGAIEPSRGPQCEPEFDIDAIPRAEIAPNIVRQNADLLGVHAKHRGELAFLTYSSAAAGMDRVA